MTVRGWLIVGGNGGGLPPQEYVGEYVGALPDAANFKAGQWLYWRPVAAVIAGASTQMSVVCVDIPI
jgi:hypothetical protein